MSVNIDDIKTLYDTFSRQHDEILRKKFVLMQELAQATEKRALANGKEKNAKQELETEQKKKNKYSTEIVKPFKISLIAELNKVRDDFIKKKSYDEPLLKLLGPNANEAGRGRTLVIFKILGLKSANSSHPDLTWASYKKVMLRACNTALNYYIKRTDDDIDAGTFSALMGAWKRSLIQGGHLDLRLKDKVIELIVGANLKPAAKNKLTGFINLFADKPGSAPRYSADGIEERLNDFVNKNSGFFSDVLRGCWRATLDDPVPQEVEANEEAEANEEEEVIDNETGDSQQATSQNLVTCKAPWLTSLLRRPNTEELTHEEHQTLCSELDLLAIPREVRDQYKGLLRDSGDKVALNEKDKATVSEFDEIVEKVSKSEGAGIRGQLKGYLGPLSKSVQEILSVNAQEILKLESEITNHDERIKGKEGLHNSAKKQLETDQKCYNKTCFSIAALEQEGKDKLAILKKQMNVANTLFGKSREGVGSVNTLLFYNRGKVEEEAALIVEVNAAPTFEDACKLCMEFFNANTSARAADFTSALVRVLLNPDYGLLGESVSLESRSSQASGAVLDRILRTTEDETLALIKESEDPNNIALAAQLVKNSTFMGLHLFSPRLRVAGHETLRKCFTKVAVPQ
ncbi:MAG: hypothetical protein COB66_06495 [Coxiella sp. (in: Bacteria)]|nr:MAG: hypothetical protein COB66_06495 [Coxiella sp. (in: g-proteobacteria)]